MAKTNTRILYCVLKWKKTIFVQSSCCSKDEGKQKEKEHQHLSGFCLFLQKFRKDKRIGQRNKSESNFVCIHIFDSTFGKVLQEKETRKKRKMNAKKRKKMDLDSLMKDS